MRKTVTVLYAIALLGCNTDPNTIEVATRSTTLSQKNTILAKTLIADLTLEPEAVRFRHLKGYKAANGHQIICGEANAKNVYGGYIGYFPFWIRLEDVSLKTLNWIGTSAESISKQCKQAGNGTVKIAPT